MDDILYLIAAPQTQDATGVIRENADLQTTGRMVYCKAESVTRAEFFAAGSNGLNPEFVFSVFAADYQGETLCMYHDKSFSIYRTYHVPGTDYLELYVERKGGSNGID